MPFLAYLIIPIAVSLVLAGMKKEVYKAEKNMDENSFVVRQSTIAMWVGIVEVLFFSACLVLMTIFPNDSDEWWVYLIFLLFILMGAVLALYCLLWEVKVEGDKIQFKSFLKRTKVFTFDDIKDIKMKDMPQYQQIILYSETKKLLAMESNCKGYNVFAARLAREREKHQ